ncbi:uncharacterized protein LOC123506554 [Portunus trituberculatus]|uniref:uncharacterized protein LOC123506554 n=1 Tax=Portunus trituberculatus TaxID=210409 RepID=UPI001E1D1B01|nr:uncharacterized protein LOC123506554 [Portunus trituberculatus]
MGPGAAVLSHALKCGTNKAPSVTLLDHLASLPDSSTANYRALSNKTKKKIFNRDEERKIGDDPSCQTFDITLLYKSITLACEGVPPSDDARWKDTALMEGLLNKIKEERNTCVHEWTQTKMDEHQFKKKLQEFEDIFIRALHAVRDRYGVCAAETSTVIDSVRLQIQDVLKAFTEKVILVMNFEKKLEMFKELSVCHLKDRYKHFECFDPLSFLCGSKQRVHVQTDDRPRLAVVSGIAGSGKTTLLTLLVSEWRREECDRRVKHLEEYDIVLRILCRDKHAEDLETFLRLVLPPSLSVFGSPSDSVARRTEFALQYSTSSTNQDRLREFMTKQKDIKLFELPLNLLFVVRLFEHNPDCMKESPTQASLYTHFHEWCTEKLCVRIATHPTWGEKRPRTLKTRIKRMVQEMYRMALHCLLQDRLSLSEEDVERLEKRCKEEDLPDQEVLGAFFTLQLSVNNSVREEHYSLPHKGLLEYFAARHIMQRLQDGSLPPSGAVRSLLQTVSQQGTFHGLRLRNLFFHVAGLLAREEVPNRTEAIKEVIELVGETGSEWGGWMSVLEESDEELYEDVPGWKEWLSLVEHTDYDEGFLQAIAHHVTVNPPGGKVWIKDNMLASAAALLPRTSPPTTVELWLYNESVNVENVRALSHYHCSELRLHHHYQHPGNTPASHAMLHTIRRSRLKQFIGHLSADCLTLLPECLTWLCLAVSSDEHATRLTAALSRASSSLPNLSDLMIHVPMSMVTPAAVLSPLPDISDVSLVLSGVDKNLVKEACQVAAALQPRRGYFDIGFPLARMEAAGWRRLLHLMASAWVTMRTGEADWLQGGLMIPEETITEEEEWELTKLTRTLWGCPVYRRCDRICFLPSAPFSLADESQEDDESDGEDDEEEEEEE